MRIGGFVKQSLIDWEGKTVAVIFTKGCNFRCGYCHNPSLVLPVLLNKTDDIRFDYVMSYLKNRKLWIDGVVISGGEPTIHKDLPDFIRKIRQYGFNIKLDTNGTNPEMIKSLIDEKLIEYVAMDIKTTIRLPDYQRITNFNNPEIINSMIKSVNIIRSSGIRYQFRTTVIPRYHSDEIITGLKKEFGNDPYIQQPFREGITIDTINSEV